MKNTDKFQNNVKKCCTRLLSAVLLLVRQDELFLEVKSSQKTTIYFIQGRLNFYGSTLVPQNANFVTSAGQLQAAILQGLKQDLMITMSAMKISSVFTVRLFNQKKNITIKTYLSASIGK